MYNPSLKWLFIALLSCASFFTYGADNTKHKPFILASVEQDAMANVKARVTQKLTQAGFEVVGEYSPYTNATIIIVTNDTLRQHATQSELGGFGAAQRVTLTQSNKGIQVGFTNPTYMAHAYRMKSDLAELKNTLSTALGMQSEYGPKEGLTGEALRDYHYKWLMPYFTDSIELVDYPDQASAIKKVESLLSSGTTGVNKIYRIDLPGKEETVIGVHMTGKNNDCSGDEYIMSRIDFKELKSTGHLPYEIVISKGVVYTLPAEFRIAISFPDLSMLGDNSFASIMCAPNSISTALTEASGGTVEF